VDAYTHWHKSAASDSYSKWTLQLTLAYRSYLYFPNDHAKPARYALGRNVVASVVLAGSLFAGSA
jgi:hypothetical protein